MAKYTIRKADFVRRMGLPDGATLVSATEVDGNVVLELSGLAPPSDQDHFGGPVSVGDPHDWVQWVPNQGDQVVTFWGSHFVVEGPPIPTLDWEN